MQGLPEPKAVMFDFFGTLVDYQPDRSRLGYPLTHDLAASLGYVGSHSEFVQTWDEASAALEAESKRTLREFTMPQASQAFAAANALDLDVDQAVALGQSFVSEWAQHVHPVVGVEAMVKELATRLTIAVVSNTHDPNMVPDMLEAMGLADTVASVTLSVEHGWAKPHPSIYSVALEQVKCSANEVVLVGDNFEADYVGPIEAGMRAFLIDPDQRHVVPDHNRLSTVLDIAQIL